MNKALNFLNALIAQGLDYAEAECRTAMRFELGESSLGELRSLYDFQD